MPSSEKGPSASPTVLILTGASGSGKSYLLEKIRGQYPDAIQIITPQQYAERLRPDRAQWARYHTIAIDELTIWDRSSVGEAIAELEDVALSFGFKLIIVSQREADLEAIGVRLKTKPALFNITPTSTEMIMFFAEVLLGGS